MICSVFLGLMLRPAIVIADFEAPAYGAWQATGTAFGTGSARGTLPNQMVVSGYQGHGFVDSYLGGDDATGELTSPSFKISRRYMNFLIGGGDHPKTVGMELVIGDKVVERATGWSSTPQDKETLRWDTWDLGKLQGKHAHLVIFDHATGSWGHILVDEIEESDIRKASPMKPEPLYHEAYRPQFHFSAKKNWLNDPNGLFYYKGEYHLFFQYDPTGVHGATKSWGQAVSTDLLHWHELPVAISPDAHGDVWSGSGAVDVHDTSGLGHGNQPVLVAMYTAAGNPFTQCLVYSNDNGRTWDKYAGNPVVGNIIGEDRDPRIFWYEPLKEWIMALYLDGNEFGIFSSPNLKSWKPESRLEVPGSAECPDMFELPVEGHPGEKKWIFFGANFRYLIGTFDGHAFHAEAGPFVGDVSDTFYASQTWNDVPDGRRIQIAWMRGPGPLPGMPFNQQMSFPCELTLRDTRDGLRIFRNPVRELDRLHRHGVQGTNLTVAEANTKLSALKSDLLDLHFQMMVNADAVARLDIRGAELVVSAADKTVSLLGSTVPIDPSQPVDLRVLVDRSSIEVFVDGGLYSITKNFEPELDTHGVRLVQDAGATSLVGFEGFEVASVWS